MRSTRNGMMFKLSGELELVAKYSNSAILSSSGVLSAFC
jgi:hypothetical protein